MSSGDDDVDSLQGNEVELNYSVCVWGVFTLEKKTASQARARCTL